MGRAICQKKLSPRFVGPYQILRRVRPVAYEITLPPPLANLHPVFHVSQLRKYVPDPSHVLEMEDLQIRGDLTIEVQPVGLGDIQMRQLRGKSIKLVQVIWDKRTGDSTWELEGDVRESYPHLFSGKSQFSSRKFLLLGRMQHPSFQTQKPNPLPSHFPLQTQFFSLSHLPYF